MLDALKKLQTDLNDLKRDVSKEHASQIGKVALRKRAEEIATGWFSTVSPSLAPHHSLSAETLEHA
jgi:hypothetical protein